MKVKFQTSFQSYSLENKSCVNKTTLENRSYFHKTTLENEKNVNKTTQVPLLKAVHQIKKFPGGLLPCQLRPGRNPVVPAAVVGFNAFSAGFDFGLGGKKNQWSHCQNGDFELFLLVLFCFLSENSFMLLSVVSTSWANMLFSASVFSGP